MPPSHRKYEEITDWTREAVEQALHDDDAETLLRAVVARMRILIWGVVIGLTSAMGWADDFSEKRLVNWHQWRGPNATGVAPAGEPPIKWDNQTNIKWKAAIPGRGTSTPIIWGDRIFLLTAIKTDRQAEPSPELPPAESTAEDASNDGPNSTAPGSDGRRNSRPGGGKPPPSHYHQFVVLCLDRKSGKTLWQDIACEVVPHQGHHPTSSYVPSSPVTDGRHLWFSFGSRGVYCYDLEGRQRWKTDLGQFEIKFGFGEGSSPALHKDTLIVNCDHEGQSFITALDARTGEMKWKVDRDENSTWNTPLITEHEGRVEVIVNGAKSLKSYNLATGELLWQHRGPSGVDAIPSPMRLGDLAILVSGFRGTPAFAIPLGSTGDLTETDRVAWKHAKGTPYIPTPVLVGDRIYFLKERSAILSCLNARTGAVIIDQQRLPLLGDIYPSPVAAAGRIYFTSRAGGTVVVDATVDEVRILAENKLDDTIVASPAIVGREMFIRGEQTLYCIAQQGKGPQ